VGLARSADLAGPGEVIHACENPQVLQALATAGVERPVACLSGNPAAAGIVLLARCAVRYHGDFDWPGIAIARRVFGLGAEEALIDQLLADLLLPERAVVLPLPLGIMGRNYPRS
jgi:hypothetical protein